MNGSNEKVQTRTDAATRYLCNTNFRFLGKFLHFLLVFSRDAIRFWTNPNYEINQFTPHQ